PALTEAHTLSLHDALPILCCRRHPWQPFRSSITSQGSAWDGSCSSASWAPWATSPDSLRGKRCSPPSCETGASPLSNSLGFERADRKSTRLNSSHVKISYA